MPLAKYHDVIKAFPSDRPDQPLTMAILPWRTRRGRPIERPKQPSRTNVVNLMDALRRSVAQEKRAPASAKKRRKRIADQTEMLLPITGKKGKEVAARSVSARQKKAG